MEINNTGSTYGAAFRQKPIFFMSGKETVAFFEGKLSGAPCVYCAGEAALSGAVKDTRKMEVSWLLYQNMQLPM